MYNEFDPNEHSQIGEDVPNQYGLIPNEPAEPPKTQKYKHRTRTLVATALICAIVGGVGGGTAVGYILNRDGNSDGAVTLQSETTATVAASTEPAATEKAAAGTPIFVTSNTSVQAMTPSEVYEKYVDAVVGIGTESTVTNIFGQVASSASSGSGFIISSDGYIVTNNHVISGANTINVTLFDGTVCDATVVGSDDQNDVALLKIDATGLNCVSIGDSSSLKVGEMVAAIGNPLGELTYTLTIGYVSALDREINADGTPINMLQTDAAINPGNSGGPLFDMYGNVIGITTAKYSTSTTTLEGLGFAIPINDVMAIVQELQANGYVTGRANFGIGVQDLSMTVATYYGLPQGVYVGVVYEGGCSEAAGMQAGDIITKIDGVEVTTVTDLTSIRKEHIAGDTVVVTVYRSGEYVDLTITLDEQNPNSNETVATTAETPSAGNNEFSHSSGSYYGGYGNAA